MEALLYRLSLRMEPGFAEDVEVEFNPLGKPSISIRLPLLLDPPTGPKSVFKFVRARTTTDAFLRQVHDAAFVFSLVVEHGFTTKEHCYVLTERISPKKQPRMALLDSLATVIDITDEDADELLKRGLKAGLPP